ncbi:MAG: hypothetical protein GY814_14650, partial [Gammaproteobacteria bacterium]|nr:hypothetical protein [Gammaproteobacteria bacterium]
MTDTAKQFLDYFTDERGGIYLFFVHKSIKGVTKSLEYKGPDTLAEAAKLNEAGFHVYFCSALRSPNFDNKGGSSYGGKKDVSYINGYHVDVDFKSKSGAHAANGSLPTKEEALAIFEQLELEPSYVVNSGNGFQLHFLFDRPLAVDATHTIRVIEKAALAFAEPIQQAFGVKGWDCDAAKTATIQRVWRLPGFDNLKTDPPNPCHIHKAAPSNRIAFSPPSTGQASENAAKKTIDNYGAL